MSSLWFCLQQLVLIRNENQSQQILMFKILEQLLHLRLPLFWLKPLPRHSMTLVTWYGRSNFKIAEEAGGVTSSTTSACYSSKPYPCPWVWKNQVEFWKFWCWFWSDYKLCQWSCELQEIFIFIWNFTGYWRICGWTSFKVCYDRQWEERTERVIRNTFFGFKDRYKIK